MFKKVKQSKYLLACLAMIFVAISCKQPETITIDADPVSNPNTDTTPEDTATAPQSADFMQLNIGELHSIHSLDPVFAQNTSTMRALQLLYEGLVRYNEQGNISPGVAKAWKVSDDSLTYTFTLRDDVFYQDSDIFPNGIGRKLVARDVRFVFERMAKATVPPSGAKLFMNVLGFEPYFQEQHNVYNPGERKLPTIQGIATPNDSTVSFKLQDHDPHFINKLASPYALLYPREAVRANNFTPIGSGPYKLSQIEDGTRFIFSKFKNYHGKVSSLSRIDIITGLSESELFQSFVRGEIGFIPEMGPQMLKGLMADRNELKPTYQNQYNLHQNNTWLHYNLKYNPNSDYSKKSAFSLVQLVDSTDKITESGDFVNIKVMQRDSSFNAIADTTTFVFTEDPFTSWLTGILNQRVSGRGVIQMQNIKTPTRNTGLFFEQYFSFTPSQYIAADPNALINMSIYSAALSNKNANGILMNSYPWWIDLRNAVISDSDN